MLGGFCYQVVNVQKRTNVFITINHYFNAKSLFIIFKVKVAVIRSGKVVGDNVNIGVNALVTLSRL